MGKLKDKYKKVAQTVKANPVKAMMPTQILNPMTWLADKKLAAAGGGGPGEPGAVAPSNYEELLSMMAMEQYNQTKPLREGMIGQYTDLMAGKLDPTQMPQWAPAFAQGKNAIESQYDIAKDNVLANAPRGGAMQGGLFDTEVARAEQASSLPQMLAGQITNDMMNQAFGTAFQTAPQLAMGGMGTAAGTLSNRLSAQIAGQYQLAAAEQQRKAQQNAALMGGAGQLLGMGLGAAFGGPAGAAIGGQVGGSAGGYMSPGYLASPFGGK